MQHNRRNILQQLHRLEDTGLGRVLLLVELTSRCTDEELCEVVENVLQALERVHESMQREADQERGPFGIAPE